MTDIAELVVRIKADATQLQNELRNATQTVKTSTDQMSAGIGLLKGQLLGLLPALSAAAFVGWAKGAIEAEGHIGDLAQRIGFAASTLAALQIPLAKSGTNIDEFASSMVRLNDALGRAAKGDQEAIKSFDQLGLSVKKLLALPQEDRLYAVAQALYEYKDAGQQTEAALNLLGRAGAALIPTIKDAHGNLKQVVDDAKNFGDAINDQQIERIKQFGDSLAAAAIHARNEFLATFAAILEGIDKLEKYVPANYLKGAVNTAISTAVPGAGLLLDQTGKPRRTDVQAELEGLIKNSGSSSPAPQTPSARGDNAGLIKAKSSALKEYIANLNQETAALSLNEKAMFVARAEIEATAKAKDDYNNGLRSSQTLNATEKDQIDALAASYYELKKAQEENERQARKMKEAMSQALTDIAFNFKNMGSTVNSVLNNIAQNIFKSAIAEPLSNSITNSIRGSRIFSSIGNLFHFADGGDPPVGVPSLVGERGPELFIPKGAGTIIPNHALGGGGQITVTNVFHISPGVPELIDAKIRQAAPFISAQTQASVFQAIQKGGRESQIAGKRS